MINSSLFERKHAVITLQGEGSRWRRPSISTGRVHRASETQGSVTWYARASQMSSWIP